MVRIFQALKDQQIYVRHFAGPRVEDYLRITIGTDEEMEVLYDFLEGYLRGEISGKCF